MGYYKGNFGNMFFLWDIIFKTAHISRQYPKEYGISHYEGDQWYAQIFWPILKSKVPGSELAAGGPVVREDVFPKPSFEKETFEEDEINNDNIGYESAPALALRPLKN
ncbi:MAG TPA: hypothetical protein VKA92_07255 [Segetibacter sp.]|nr:hypothetical protein [Segetibacter sp.]